MESKNPSSGAVSAFGEGVSVKRRGLIPQSVLVDAVAELGRLVKATQRVRAGNGQYEDVPDNSIRFQACKAIIELETGKATQSVEVSNIAGAKALPTTADALMLLKQDPKLAARIFDGYLSTMKSAVKDGVLEVCGNKPDKLVE